MRPTRGSDLAGAGALAGTATAVLVHRLAPVVPPLPVSAPVSLVVVAGAVAVTARTTRARLAHRPGTRPVPPLVAARLVALAKAGSLAGVLLAGAWAGVLAVLAGHLGDSAPARTAALVAGTALLAALALVAASLALEHACRLPPEDGDAPGTPGGGTGAPRRAR